MHGQSFFASLFFCCIGKREQVSYSNCVMHRVLYNIRNHRINSCFPLFLFLLFNFYLNNTTCEIPFLSLGLSLPLSLSLSRSHSLPFVCVCMREMQNNHTTMNPCNCLNDERRRWCQQFFSFALLFFPISLRASVCICLYDRSLVRLCQ